MIKTENLTKSFNGHLAVDRLSLSVEDGEVFGFLGPNGAGKTTTVRMLTALIGPSAGSAQIMGYRLGQDDQAIRRNVGILTETPGLYDRLSAWRNLMIYARLYEVPEPEKQVEKYLRWLELWDRRKDVAGSLSKGMRQKLAIARSMLHEPKVIFLDEPTSALDPEAAKLVRDFVEELKGEGRTIFLCTHNLDEADRLCDRIAVFKTHLRVVDSPRHLRTQLFGRQVVFHLANDPQPFLEPLGRMDGVRAAEVLEGRLVARMDEPELKNPAVIRELVALGAEVQFVGEVSHSLEDIYLQLMKE
jgi:ABC-2 type transport system ATP-binding protein